MKIRNYFLRFVLVGLLGSSASVQAGAYEDMLQAIHLDDEKAIVELFRRGMDVDTVSPKGESLLMLAVREGKPSVVKTILAARPRLHVRNPLGESALMLAAILGHTEIAKMLLDAADLRRRPQPGRYRPHADRQGRGYQCGCRERHHALDDGGARGPSAHVADAARTWRRC